MSILVAVEQWRQVTLEGYGDLYEVSDKGNVRSLDRVVTKRIKGTPFVSRYKGRLLAQRKTPYGYLICDLKRQGDKTTITVHRLVALAFMPPTLEYRVEVNHIDGVKTNNCVGNLEWVTSSGNKYHSFAIGLRRPEDSAKHTEQQMRHAYSLVASGMIVREAALEAGCTYSAVRELISGKSWRHLGLPRIRRNRSKNWCKN